MSLAKKLSDLSQLEVDERIKICNLTEEEEKIFYLLSKRKTRVEIAQIMQISTRTLDRRISRIKNKMLKYGKNIDGGEIDERSTDL